MIKESLNEDEEFDLDEQLEIMEEILKNNPQTTILWLGFIQ